MYTHEEAAVIINKEILENIKGFVPEDKVNDAQKIAIVYLQNLVAKDEIASLEATPSGRLNEIREEFKQKIKSLGDTSAIEEENQRLIARIVKVAKGTGIDIDPKDLRENYARYSIDEDTLVKLKKELIEYIQNPDRIAKVQIEKIAIERKLDLLLEAEKGTLKEAFDYLLDAIEEYSNYERAVAAQKGLNDILESI